MKNVQSVLHNLLLVAVAPFSLCAISSQANAETVDDLKKDAAQALQILYKNNPVAETISKNANKILLRRWRHIDDVGLLDDHCTISITREDHCF